MKFTDTEVCQAKIHCTTCRDKENGIFWRKSIGKYYEIDKQDFECPHGIPWGGKSIPKTNTPKTYTLNNKLGDNWTMVNWISDNIKNPKITRTRLTEEILDLLELPNTPTLTEEVDHGASPIIHWIKYHPTKIRWTSGKYNRICYQFDGRTYNLPQDQQNKILDNFKNNELIRLGDHISLRECVQIASQCDLFIGISSGMSHVMHSVGIPMFLNAIDLEISQYHYMNQSVICKNTDDTILRINKYLETNEYKPQIFEKSECTRCAARLWHRIKDLSGSLKDVAKYITDEKVSHQEYERRKQICQSCQFTDSDGNKMFRKVSENYYSCGILRFDKILRDSKTDGCGCVLNIKWAGKTQKCPHSQW